MPRRGRHDLATGRPTDTDGKPEIVALLAGELIEIVLILK